MRNLFLSGAGSILIACAAAPAGAQVSAACNADWPQAGTLYLTGPGLVRVFRYDRRRPVEAGNGAPVCVGDFVPARPSEGRVVLLNGETLTLAANQPLTVPDRRWSLLRWLRDPRMRRELFRVAGAGVLGPDRVGFALEGLETGVAEIGMSHRTLVIPVNEVDATLQVELWAPGPRLLRTVAVPPGAGEVEFRAVRPQRGEWRVVIRQEPPIIGAFHMVDRVGDADIAALAAEARLGERDTLLALACIDPPRHGLEAYQRAVRSVDASREDRAKILSWRNRTEHLSCGTPTARQLGLGRQ